jgi:hypothetical protein
MCLVPCKQEMFPSLLDPAHDTLADDICGLSAHIAAAQAELAAKTARFNATMAWAEGGIRSCAEFLSQNAGLDLGTGHDLIGVGDALDRLPLLAEACGAGELSFDKARAVASVATEVDQEMWVELALFSHDVGDIHAANLSSSRRRGVRP